MNKEAFSLPRVSMKRLRGKSLSIHRQEIKRRIVRMFRCKFDRSIAISQIQRELVSRFSQDANQALEDPREDLVTEVS